MMGDRKGCTVTLGKGRDEAGQVVEREGERKRKGVWGFGDKKGCTMPPAKGRDESGRVVMRER